jgi:hypothetical protein
LQLVPAGAAGYVLLRGGIGYLVSGDRHGWRGTAGVVAVPVPPAGAVEFFLKCVNNVEKYPGPMRPAGYFFWAVRWV